MAAWELEKEWASKARPACLYCGAVNPKRDEDGACLECGGPITNHAGGIRSDDSVSVVLDDDGDLERHIQEELATVKKA